MANPDAFADALDGRPQKWAAEKAGMSVSHMSEVASGRKGATPEVARHLAEVLGCRAGTLFPQLANFRTEVRVFTVAGADERPAA